jgi:hypothetical protein
VENPDGSAEADKVCGRQPGDRAVRRVPARSALVVGVGIAAVALILLGLALRARPTGSGQPMPTTPDGRVEVPAAEPVATSPEAARAIEQVRGRFPLDDRQANCVAAELDRRTGLRASVGEGGAGTEQLDDVAAVVGPCVARTTMADQFAVNVATQAGGLDQGTLACLRDGYAGWSGDQHTRLAGAVSAPGTTVPEVYAMVDGLLARCGVDRSRLPVP